MHEEASERRWPRGIWLLLLATPLTLLALIPYNHPANDDYWYAVAAQQHGFCNAHKLWYQTWNGRYTATTIQMAFPLLVDMIRTYPLVPAVVLPLFAASLALFFLALNRALRRPLSRRAAGGAGLLVFALYVAQMPSPCDGFYWLASVATYSVPLIGALGTLSCALAVGRNSRPAVVALASLGAAVLAAVTAGGNEPLIAPLGVVLLAGTAISAYRKHPSAWVWGAATAAFALGTAVLVLAPGNAARGANFHKSALLAFVKTAPKLLLWLVSGPMLWGTTLLSIPTAVALGRRLPWARAITGRHVIAAAAITAALMVLSILPAAHVGLTAPRRLLNVPYLIFLLGWFATALLAVQWYCNTRGRPPLSSPRWRLLGTGLFVGGVLLASNFPRAAYDLSYAARRYDAQMQARYAALRQMAAAGERHPVIDPLRVIPKTIHPGTADDDRAAAVHLAYYFRLAAPTVTVGP